MILIEISPYYVVISFIYAKANYIRFQAVDFALAKSMQYTNFRKSAAFSSFIVHCQLSIVHWLNSDLYTKRNCSLIYLVNSPLKLKLLSCYFNGKIKNFFSIHHSIILHWDYIYWNSNCSTSLFCFW